MLPQSLRPLRLPRRIEPFDLDQFIFELKIDGFPQHPLRLDYLLGMRAGRRPFGR